MKKESFIGVLVIISIVSILFGILYQINQNYLSDMVIVAVLIIFAGIISGIILNEYFKSALIYMFAIGEALIGIVFVAMFITLQDFQNEVSNSVISGAEGIALIMIIILFLVILIGGAVFIGIFVVLLLFGGTFGIKIRGLLIKNSNV